MSYDSLSPTKQPSPLYRWTVLIFISLAMFGNVLGTWIPFVLIFISTYYTGRREEKKA